jgi:hypothetical protein
MEYTSIHTMKTGWVLGKISNHQAIALTEEELDRIVKALNENEEFVARYLFDEPIKKKSWEELHQSASVKEDVEKPR